MAYLTQTDLVNKYGTPLLLRLLDDNIDGTIDPDALTLILEDTDSDINGYLAGNHTIATIAASQPPLARAIALPIALQKCYERKPDHPMPEWVEKAATRSYTMLERIRKNEIRFDVDGVPQNPANAGVTIVYGSNDTYPDGFGCGTFENGFGDF